MRGEEGDLGMSNTFMAVDLGEKNMSKRSFSFACLSVFSTLLLCLI
jgi:hypothetical protein